MLYFTFTIMYEQKRLKNLSVKYFLEADNAEVHSISQTTYRELLALTAKEKISPREIDVFTNAIKERIKPYNIAGLLEPSSKNMYHHTVAEL